MSEINMWVKNIVFFMILSTIINNLLGNSSYKKYVSLATGMIMVLIVTFPLTKILKLDMKMDYLFKKNKFTVDATDFKNQLMKIEDKQNDEIFIELESSIKNQVEGIVEEEGFILSNCTVIFDKDYNSEDFGMIKSIIVEANYKKNNDSSKKNDVKTVSKVTISRIKVNDENDENKKPPSPDEIIIKDRLSDFYNLDKGNINISIQGE